MSKLAKIVITILIVVVFIALTAVVTGSREAAGYSTPGILAIALLAGAIGGIRAIWKKKDEKQQ